MDERNKVYNLNIDLNSFLFIIATLIFSFLKLNREYLDLFNRFMRLGRNKLSLPHGRAGQIFWSKLHQI